MKIAELTAYLEKIAPLDYQESYDNSGLIVGHMDDQVTGVLITLDCIECIVEEAIDKKCNLIIAHHPIIFSGLKKLNGKNYIERTIIKAIKNNIAIYALHTNLDNIYGGVSFELAKRIGLINVTILAPKKLIYRKLVTYCPINASESLLEALYKAGAGNIGNYSNCSFSSEGLGSFLPNEFATPTIGNKQEYTNVAEQRLELIYPVPLERKVLEALHQSHPYETPAYDLLQLENHSTEVGSGAIGKLKTPIPGSEFLSFLKNHFSLGCIRHTEFLERPIFTVAVCGGSGSSLLKDAIIKGADVYISADFKYHDFFDAENKIVIADIGHYETEVYTKDLIYNFLTKKFSNIAIRLSEIGTNPIRYV